MAFPITPFRITSLNPIYVFLLIITAVASVYHNSLVNSFVYDDITIIVKQNFIKHWGNLPILFTRQYLARSEELSYRPVVTFTYMVDHHLWGLNPLGFHLTNILLHLLCVILIYLLGSYLISDKRGLLISSLLFAVHPVNTEPVNGISYREDILATIFYLGAFILWLESNRLHRNIKKKLFYGLSLFSFFLAIFSKEMAVTLPLTLLAYDHFFYRGDNRQKCSKPMKRKYLGYVLVLGFFFLVRFYLIRDTAEAKIAYPGNSFYTNTLTMMTVFLYYMKVVFLPLGLTCHYLFPIASSVLSSKVILAAIVLGILIWALIATREHVSSISFLIFWFLISFLPVINIIPISNIVAERYLYLPLGVLCLLLPAATVSLFRTKRSIFIFIPIILFYGYLAHQRNYEWKDNISLWQSAASIYPQSAKVHINLGMAYQEKKAYQKAITEYQTAQQLNPARPEADNNLAGLFLEIGQLYKAISIYKIALEKNSNDPIIHYNLGMAYMVKGELDKALKLTSKAVQLKPDYVNAHNGLAIIYSRLGNTRRAQEEWEKALKIDPDHTNARKNYNRFLQRLKRESGNIPGRDDIIK